MRFLIHLEKKVYLNVMQEIKYYRNCSIVIDFWSFVAIKIVSAERNIEMSQLTVSTPPSSISIAIMWATCLSIRKSFSSTLWSCESSVPSAVSRSFLSTCSMCLPMILKETVNENAGRTRRRLRWRRWVALWKLVIVKHAGWMDVQAKLYTEVAA